jgi:hypothetical protein
MGTIINFHSLKKAREVEQQRPKLFTNNGWKE